MTLIDDLMARSIDDGTDRMNWLRARQGRITASMIGKMQLGGAAARRVVLEESFEPPVEITGNKYIDRGHEREPIIAAWVAKKWPGMQPNLHLFHAAENTRWAATPDGIGLSPQGTLSLLEIKTSKYDRHPDAPYFERTGYYEQCQWQMLVTGAAQTLFVWEQHDDDWDNGPTPIHPEPRHHWFTRDEEMIEQLKATATLALAERDQMAAEMDAGDDQVEDELSLLAAEVLDARKAEATAKARLKEPWAKLLTAVDGRDEFSAPHGRANVTWSNRTTEEWQPDLEAALLAPGGSDLKAALEQAQDDWNAHQAKYMRKVQRQISKLTVTERKTKPSAADSGEF